MNNEPVAWMHQNPDYAISKHQSLEYNIPLYTHQYERPHNTVLVPCDKLAEMQAEIETLKAHPVKELDEQFKKGFEAGKEEGWKAHKFHHPVKDLEDIDINITWNENSMRDFGKDELAFARAILRKASEK